MNSQQLFESSEKLIYDRSWFYSRKWNMDFEEIKSQAFEIFCEAVRRFEKGKNTRFTTYLYHRLRTLNDYCQRERKIERPLVPYMKSTRVLYLDSAGGEVDFGQTIIPGEKERGLVDAQTLERMAFYEAVQKLSSESQFVVECILDGTFHSPFMVRQRKINKYRVRKIATLLWNWSNEQVDRVWGELKGWWNENCEKIIA